jgi:hypothetical protein
MNHQTFLNEIHAFPWDKAEPFKIILLSLATAQEFGVSLRMALEVHPDDENLRTMAAGELDTDNLTYRSYHQRGDHFQFLEYFILQFPTWRTSARTENLKNAIRGYGVIMHNMSPEHRAQTIFSRERELPGIFEKILGAHDWDALGFGFYRYYLERHIMLDSASGGHADLTREHELNEDVLLKFYGARYMLYQNGLA